MRMSAAAMFKVHNPDFSVGFDPDGMPIKEIVSPAVRLVVIIGAKRTVA